MKSVLEACCKGLLFEFHLQHRYVFLHVRFRSGSDQRNDALLYETQVENLLCVDLVLICQFFEDLTVDDMRIGGESQEALILHLIFLANLRIYTSKPESE